MISHFLWAVLRPYVQGLSKYPRKKGWMMDVMEYVERPILLMFDSSGSQELLRWTSLDKYVPHDDCPLLKERHSWIYSSKSGLPFYSILYSRVYDLSPKPYWFGRWDPKPDSELGTEWPNDRQQYKNWQCLLQQDSFCWVTGRRTVNTVLLWTKLSCEGIGPQKLLRPRSTVRIF